MQHEISESRVTTTNRTLGCILGGVAAALLVGAAVVFRRMKKAAPATQRLQLLGVPIDPVSMPEALARIEDFIRSGRPHHVLTADASGIMRARHDPDLMEIVRQADLSTPDGAGVLWASRMRGTALPERVSGVDLVERISGLAAQKGYRIYLLGAAEGVADDASEALTSRHPGLTIAGTHNGYFTPQDEPQLVQEIARAHPDVLFVALGIPKQELFIRRHFEELGVPVMVGIGGSFDVISGRLQRAPRWMQRAGFEWLFRLLQEPMRLPRLAALPQFIMAAWRERNR